MIKLTSKQKMKINNYLLKIYLQIARSQNNEIKLNLSRLSSAEYLIRLTAENYEYSAKIIKE